jgi:hypothetical protein
VVERNWWGNLEVLYGDSTISHKAEVLPETKAEGPQRKEKEGDVWKHSLIKFQPKK